MKNYWKLGGLLFFLLLSLVGKAQTIKGFVKDAETQQPLVGVNVFVDGLLIGTATDENGYFSLSVQKLPIVLSFSFIGYESEKKTITKVSQDGFRIFLKEKASILPEIAVIAKPEVEQVYATSYSVIDYEFYDDYIILLIYRNVFAKYALLLLDKAGNELSEKPIKGMKPERLGKSCLGGTYLFSTVFAHQIYLDSLDIKFSFREDVLVFEAHMNPCVTANMDYVYFKDSYYQNQYVQYYSLMRDGSSKTKHNIAIVMNEEKILMALDEGSFQTLKAYVANAHEQGVYETDPYGKGKSIPTMDEGDMTFVNKILYKPIFVPLFISQDTLFLFNHLKSKLQKLSIYGDLLEELPIDYHDEKKWRKEIVFDQEQRKAYTLFDTKTGLAIANIKMEDGSLGEPIVFEREFVEQIKAKDGYIYFLYRNPRVSDRVRKLEKIRVY